MCFEVLYSEENLLPFKPFTEISTGDNIVVLTAFLS